MKRFLSLKAFLAAMPIALLASSVFLSGCSSSSKEDEEFISIKDYNSHYASQFSSSQSE